MPRPGAREYIPLTAEGEARLNEAIGDRAERLFETVPDELRLTRDLDLPEPLAEDDLTRLARNLAGANITCAQTASFLGAGCYDHFIPAAVDEMALRGEFLTAYTPYQAEASQGTLTATFEYQTMIAELTGLEISNASVYDGATALAESVLMARRIRRGGGAVVVSEAVHPEYLEVLRTYLQFSDVEVRTAPLDGGVTDLEKLSGLLDGAFAVVAASPNFYGAVEDLRSIFEAGNEAGALGIAVVNPISLGVLEAPGNLGAEIACGDGQPLGCPQSFGGPAFGFIATREKHIRKLPGRIVGETRDPEGRRGFCLTFQTREQHIRREKATSNICTNNALMAIRAAVYCSLLGPTGIREVGQRCLAKAHYAAERISYLGGYELALDVPFFDEFLIRTPVPAREVVHIAAEKGFLAGVPLSRFFPERENELLVAVTERRQRVEIDEFAEVLDEIGGGK